MIEIVEAIGGYLAGKEKEKGYKNIGLTSFLVGFTFLILILEPLANLQIHPLI
jgi:hypothetical protein